MLRCVLVAVALVVGMVPGTGAAQNDKEMACSMAPGLALGLDGIEQMVQRFAALDAQLAQMRQTAPEVAALLERFVAESAAFAAIYRLTVGELQRICHR